MNNENKKIKIDKVIAFLRGRYTVEAKAIVHEKELHETYYQKGRASAIKDVLFLLEQNSWMGQKFDINSYFDRTSHLI